MQVAHGAPVEVHREAAAHVDTAVVPHEGGAGATEGGLAVAVEARGRRERVKAVVQLAQSEGKQKGEEQGAREGGGRRHRDREWEI
jgi:hypothetical protein